MKSWTKAGTFVSLYRFVEVVCVVRGQMILLLRPEVNLIKGVFAVYKIPS